MTIEQFLRVFHQILTEFKYLNEHFDAKKDSTTAQYDVIFANWKRDMFKQQKHLVLDMHWAKSSQQIEHNEIVFDVTFREDYLCEIKYRFNEKFIASYSEEVNTAIAIFKDLSEKFSKLNESYDAEKYPETKEYEAIFTDWKNKMYEKLSYTALDIHWGKKMPKIKDNPVYFTMMYKDSILFQMKYNLYKEIIVDLDSNYE